MAVCNLQSKVEDHADKTVDMGLRMVNVTNDISAKDDKFDMQVMPHSLAIFSYRRVA